MWTPRCSSWILKRQKNQRSNCQHPMDHRKSKRVPEKHLFLLYWLRQSIWLCGSLTNCGNFWKKLENCERDGNTRPPSCLLRNLYAGQEATVRTGHGTTYWFQIGKGGRQGCIWSPCLFSLYAEYIMRNGELEAQAGVKIAGRNINNLRYVEDTICRGPMWGTPPIIRN